jgi:AraC family transcriptional regulator
MGFLLETNVPNKKRNRTKKINHVEAMQSLSNDNKNRVSALKHDDNTVVFSVLSDFCSAVNTEGFAIKYVVDGIEKYTLDGEKYPIQAGEYLLSNASNEGFVEIESRKTVRGICINIKLEMLAEVVASHCVPNTAYTDFTLGQFFNSNHFLENKYNAKHTNLGKLLIEMGLSIGKNTMSNEHLNDEFFYTISEKIVADHVPIFKQLQTIPSIKPSTKKDLFRRVSRGKEFIDATFLSALTIESVAQEACMSEYHFFRLFKSVFGVSPHQYMLKKRLELGHSMLSQDKDSVSIAALESGFSDIHAFSKAFKKHYGFAPSSLLK